MAIGSYFHFFILFWAFSSQGAVLEESPVVRSQFFFQPPSETNELQASAQYIDISSGYLYSGTTINYQTTTYEYDLVFERSFSPFISAGAVLNAGSTSQITTSSIVNTT